MFEFMKTAQAKPLRIKNAWEEGIRFLESGDYNRVWLAARAINLESPDCREANLLFALVDYRKSKVLKSPYCLLLGHELAPQPWYLLGGPLPDAMEDARYGAELFLSAVDEEGNANISTNVSGIKH